VIAVLILGSAAAILTLPGSLELLLLTLAGMLPARTFCADNSRRQKVIAVVPAHNEEINIARTVASLRKADDEGMHLTVVVIADNCSDATAEKAESAGARVLVRKNANLRGKGYALDFAFQMLLPEEPDFFIVVDADSEVSGNFLTAIASAFRGGANAAQCRYVVRNSGESVRTRLMNVALYAFNVLRPRGRDRLGLSAGIYGNGFALSAGTLRAVPYTAASVVEDLEYHLALVRSGRNVRFVDSASVYGDMPIAGAGVKTQRARWEGGRLRMMLEKSPVLLGEVFGGRFRLAEPLLDLLLLPLAFHVTLLLVALVAPSALVRGAAVAGLGVVGLHLVGAIVIGGGSMRDVAVLLAAPFYILWKLLLVPKLIATSRSGAGWVRTERKEEKLP
jgi:cellulose synthase/poly-beta-1,6-N-acetylglucosamine synthase-like glycosyltransferase